MSTELRRRCGVVFESVSVDKAAAKCTRAAATWGGLVMVMCDPAGLVEAFIPGTICADTEITHRASDLVGTYSAPHQREKERATRELIAGDIWHHLTQRAAA